MDKEIKELSTTLYSDFCKGCPNCKYDGYIMCLADYNCKQFTKYCELVEELKRTQKQTAKNILQFIFDKCDGLVADKSPESIEFVDFARNELVAPLATQYGIEVE